MFSKVLFGLQIVSLLLLIGKVDEIRDMAYLFFYL